MNRIVRLLMLLGGVGLWGMAAVVQAQIPLNNVAKISSGVDTTCAIVNGNGAVQCWGARHYIETYSNINVPMAVATDIPSAGKNVAEIQVGANHGCVLTNAGGVKCWGQNSYGQLGDNTTVAHPHGPADVVGLTSGVTAITAGANHFCVLTNTGAAKCWGRNNQGQLGINSTVNSLVPATVVGLEQGVVAITARADHTCAILETGEVKCWGSNSYSELGDGTQTQSPVPVTVRGLYSVLKITAGDNHNCALMPDGRVRCWGANDSGQSGVVVGLPYILMPLEVENLTDAVDIATSGKRSCAITNAGAVKCWGSNLDSTGAQGNNATPYNASAVAVPGWESGITKLAVGDYHTCALHSSGSVSCVGWNQTGQLGDNSLNPSVTPVATFQSFAPTMGYVSAGDSQAVVRFTPPVNDSGSPVTGYTVTAVAQPRSIIYSSLPPDGVDAQAGTTTSYYGPNELSHLVTGLTNDYYWTFRVIATNALGTGLPSYANGNRVMPKTVTCNRGNVVVGGTYTSVFSTSDCTDSAWRETIYTHRYIYNAVAGDQISFQTHTAGRIYLLDIQGHSTPYPSFTPTPYSYFTLPYSGPYLIEVSPYAAGQTGTVSFSVLAPGVGPFSSSSSSRSSSSRASSSSIVSSSSRSSSSIASSSSLLSSSSTSSSSAGSSSIAATTSSSSSALTSSSLSSAATSASSSVSSITTIGGCAVQPLTVGTSYSGALASTDCRTGTRGTNYYTDIYSFSGVAGQQVYIQLNSSAFDTYLYLRDVSGYIVGSNDDSGGSTNSRIPVTSGYFTLPTSGNYSLEVSSYSNLSTGAYSIGVHPGPIGWGSSSSSLSSAISSSSASSQATGCVTTTANVGVIANGTLAAGDCTNGARGSSYYADRFSFYAYAGQQISILLTSSFFDTYVYLKSPTGTVLTSNDDGGGGSNSRIPASSGWYTVPTSGTYVIEVTSYATMSTGTYNLLLSN